MNYLTHTLAFAVGASIGAAATYILVKKKYEKKASEDIEAMKKHYKNKDEDEVEIEEKEEELSEPEQEPTPIEEYEEVVNNFYTQKYEEEDLKPYIIDEETYHQMYKGYDKVLLTYYEEDGTLADEDYVYDDIDYAIGADNLRLFDSQDVFYIRNPHGGYDAEVKKNPGSYDYDN